MPPTAKAVLISMADQAGDNGQCWPSIDTISERTCVSRRSVIDAVKWLEESRVLVADRSNGRHTKYRITPVDFVPSERMSVRSMNRQTGADAAPPPMQMPHGCDSDTSADAAPVAVQMPHGSPHCTGADAAPTGADAARDQCGIGRKPVQMPHSNHKEPSLNHQGTINGRDVEAELMTAFLVFYAAYPRKVNRPAAWKAWKALRPDDALQALILAAVSLQRKSIDWTKENRKYVPYPASYLNGKRWEDEGGGAAPVGQSDWFKAAGFTHIAEAQNARCHIGNYRDFRDGKRIASEMSA